MTTQASAQIRLVKCPRCRKILPELPELPIYKCGVCGTVLQAKIRKSETNHTKLPSQETDSAERGQQDNVSGQVEDRSSNNDLTDSPKVALSTDENNVPHQEDNSLSDVQDSFENSPSGRSPQKHRSKWVDSGECIAGSSTSNELPSSGEISLEAEAYTSEVSEHVEQSHLHLDNSVGQMKDGESEHVDNVSGQVEDRSSNNDLTDSPKVALSPDENNVLHHEDNSLSDVQDSLENSPSGRSPQKHRSKWGDSGEWIAGSSTSNELPSSGEISLEAEAYTSEVSEHVEQSHLHLDNSVGQMKDGESEHVDNVSGQVEDRSSNNDLTDSPKVALSPDENNVPHQEDNSLSDVQDSLENSPSGRSPQKHRSKRGDSGEWIAGSSTSNELPSSGEISLEAEAYTSEVNEHVEQSHLHHNSVGQMKDGESAQVWPEGDNLVDEVQNFPGYEIQESGKRVKDNDIVPENEETSQSFLTEQNGESSVKINHVGLDSSLDNGTNDHPLSRSSSTGKSTSLKASDSIRAPRSPSKGSLVSFYLTSDDEQLDHSPREVVHKFQRFSSVDSLGSQHLDGLSSELNFTNESAHYYPTSRSYYAHDGSESSYDGTNGQVSHPLRKDKGLGHIRTREELKRNRFSEEERTYRAMHHPSSRGISTEANRYTTRSRMRVDAHEDLSRLPFPSRDHRHDLPPPHPAFNLSDKPPYSDPDKIDLLRTVWHLKDQLQRMHFNPPPHHLLAPERNMYAGLYNHRHDNANDYGERYNERRMAFSGEAAHFRHQTSCSCLHCSPQDRHYSAQLPMHRRNSHNDYNCYDRSNASSPHRDEINRLQLREKYNMGKRHLRPIAGGAPVVTCYLCSELLQLPVDFLLFKKRYHQLMCNACRKVLKFSFFKGTHLVPYVADTSAPPPPSEAGDYHDATGGRSVERPSHVDSVSISDDLGQSFDRNCSTGEASVGLASFDRGSVNRNTYGEVIMDDRKLKGLVKEESVGPSRMVNNRRNVSTSVSEIEELPPLANSPLHRLMGYSTPSQVFKR